MSDEKWYSFRFRHASGGLVMIASAVFPYDRLIAFALLILAAGSFAELLNYWKAALRPASPAGI